MNRLPRQQRRRKRRASRQRSDRPLRSALNARDLLQVKARIFGKRRQKGILAGGYRRSQLPACEVLRGFDRSIVQHSDAHRRVICASSERDGRQPLMACRIEAEGEAMPKSNRASPIACAAATEPDPRAISTSSPCFSQKHAGTVPAAPWHISCSLWREATARDKE